MDENAELDWNDIKEEAFDLIRRGIVEPNFSDIAKHFKIPVTTLTGNFKKLGVFKDDLSKVGFGVPDVIDNEELNTRELTSDNSGRITSLKQLLEYCEVDLDVWEVERHVVNKWEVGAKDSHKNIKVHPLFQVKAWLRRKELKPAFPTVHQITVEVNPPRQVKRKRKGVHRSLAIADPQTGFRRNIHTGDLVPFQDRRVLDIALQLIEYQEFDDITWLGDTLDQSEWTTKFLVEPEFMFTTQPALLEQYWWLSQTRQLAPKADIDIIFGNHNRMKTAITTHLKAAYELRSVDELDLGPAVSLEKLLALHTLDIGFIEDYPDGKKWMTDSFFYQHGKIVRGGSGDTAKAVLNKYQYTVGFGHVHRRELVSGKMMHSDGHQIHTAFCPGAACHIDGRVPGSSSDAQWQQGLAVAEYIPDEPDIPPHVTLMGIDNGVGIYDGKVFTARKRDVEIDGYIKKGLNSIDNGG
jgi:hypothetical protein